MKNKSREEKQISRRGILPILGGGLLIPFLGFGNSIEGDKNDITDDSEYQTLLKPDGTSVKVKVSTLKKSKVIKKNISNSSLLKWLGRKL
ncbi:MAG: hypothetical protein QM478_09155 [Flavobacteriaceae bacterium]